MPRHYFESGVRGHSLIAGFSMIHRVMNPSWFELDYEFAWREFLPFSTSDKLMVYGLDASAVNWWREERDFASATDEATAVLVALDRVDESTIACVLELPATRWVCAWGSSSKLRRFTAGLSGYDLVRQYALLPSSRPRVVVPLSERKATIDGLRLHRPGRLRARFLVWLAALLARFNNHSLLRRRGLVIAVKSQESSSEVDQAVYSPGMAEESDYALYLGNSGPMRKTVVFPVLQAPNGVVTKSARSASACAALAHEAKTLAYLANTSVSGNVPNLISLVETDSEVLLTQEYRQRKWVPPRRFQRAVIEFLVALFDVSPSKSSLGEMLLEIPAEKGAKEMIRLRQRVLQLGPDTVIRKHRVHGDFAPWNCSWTSLGLFVYDWEESEEKGLALDDAFHYVLAPLMLIGGRVKARKAVERALCFSQSVVVQVDSEKVSSCLYLALWLLQQRDSKDLHNQMAAELLEIWK